MTALATSGLRNNPTIIRKATNENLTTSTTLQNDDELLIAIGANEVWAFMFVIFYTATDSTPDIKCAVTFPAGATCFYGLPVNVGQFTDDTVSFFDVQTTSGNIIGNMAATANTKAMTIVGNISNGATSGNLQLQWAEVTSSGTLTVKAGSFLMAWKR